MRSRAHEVQNKNAHARTHALVCARIHTLTPSPTRTHTCMRAHIQAYSFDVIGLFCLHCVHDDITRVQYGKLPLHYASGKQAGIQMVEALLLAYPDAVSTKDHVSYSVQKKRDVCASIFCFYYQTYEYIPAQLGAVARLPVWRADIARYLLLCSAA